MNSRIPLVVIAGIAAALLARQRRDIARYARIKQMSLGGGHPENVPAAGRQAYPGAGGGVPDGTGDFESASRGGPVPVA